MDAIDMVPAAHKRGALPEVHGPDFKDSPTSPTV